MDDLDLEPDDEPSLEPDGVPALAGVLPADFPLLTLLRFLPDVRLKKRVTDLAADALDVEVQVPGGLARADAALPPLRDAVDEVTRCFAEPTSLAYQLHKRLTGLRADFIADGEKALDAVNARIKAEQRRLAALDEERRRVAQAEADRQAKAAAALAAKGAAARGAPKDVVAALKEQAKAAVAPPVSVAPSAAPLRNSTVVEQWKARLKGTPDDAEPNPAMDALTLRQQQQVRALLRAIADGQVPLTAVALDWGYLNGRAGAEKTTLAIPEVEAYDVGGVRKKAGRR